MNKSFGPLAIASRMPAIVPLGIPPNTATKVGFAPLPFNGVKLIKVGGGGTFESWITTEAVFVGSTALVAVSVTESGVGILEGAVYVMEPPLGALSVPLGELSDQFTLPVVALAVKILV